MTKRKLTFDETADAVRENDDFNDEMHEMLAKSGEEIDRELAAAGVDLEALDKALDAKDKELLKVKPTSRRARDIGFFSGGAALAAALAAIYVSTTAVTVPIGSGPHEDTPAEIRDKAFTACGHSEWQKCLDGFDKAKQVDAPGDYDPDVQRTRRMATHALAAEKDGGR